MLSAEAIRQQARALGFNRVGLTPARPAPHLHAYLHWLENAMHGDMAYLARPDRVARRLDFNAILPGAATLILVGLDYYQNPPPAPAIPHGRVAAYAWGRDYHKVMTSRLRQLAHTLGAPAKVYVDTGAVLERDHAQQAGLGFVGKNTLLIHPRRGSYFFIGEIITTAPADEYDTPGRDTQCGSCARCLAACPTQAFPQPYVLDARRCISYLTIEHPGPIPLELRPLVGNWVFGCDDCQTACPWNRFAVRALETSAAQAELALTDPARAYPPLADLLNLTPPAFAERYANTPLQRLGRDRLVRNACVAAGNSGQASLRPALTARLSDPSPLVREHAAWALSRLPEAV